MKHIRSKWTIIGVLVVAIGALTAFKFESVKAPQYFTEQVQKGDIQDVVQATGTINAVTSVQVGSEVSGTIQKLNADFNSHVSKDQIIAQIEPSLFQGAVLQAKADLGDAQANLAVAKANLNKAKAAAVQAKQDLGRYQGLADAGVIPKQQLDAAIATSQSDDAAVAAAHHPRLWLEHSDLTRGGGGRGGVLHGGGDLLRLLSGEESGAARSHRSLAV